MRALAAIFRRHGPASRAQCADRVLPSPLAAMAAIEQCRTEALGGPLSQCTACGALAYRDHAWKNRHGPKCQHAAATRWLAQQRTRLLPVPSLLVPCTLPAVLRPVARAPPHGLSNLLLPTAAAAWQARTLDPHALGGQSGMVGVLHTWPRDLASPPPVPSLVPGGALSPEGVPWLSPRSAAWLVPVRARSRLCRGTCKAALTRAGLGDPVPPQVWHKAWVTHGKPAGTGTEVLTDFAPSISRIALTTNRLEALEDGQVTCRFTKRRGAGWKRLTLPAEAFIHRFLPPVLPRGVINVRSSGVLSPSRRTGLPQIRALLAACPSTALAAESAPPRDGHPTGPAPPQEQPCRRCGGPLVFLVRLSPHAREPPESARAVPIIQRWRPVGLGARPRCARPCRRRLRGLLWPAPAPSVEACRPPRPSRTNAPRQDSRDAVLSPLVSPLGSAPMPLLCASAA